MSQDPNVESPEIWQVAIAPDNVQTMTLEQLDAAYEQGVITEQTLVWTDGMEEWLPLAEVAGAGDEAQAAAAPEPTVPVVAPAPTPFASQPPIGVVAAPVTSAFPPAAGSFPPAAGSFPPAAGSFPPAGVSRPPFAGAPMLGVTPAAAGFPNAGSSPVSTAPVAMSLDGLDLDSLAMPKSGGKGKFIFAAVAAVGLIGGGIAVAGGGGGEVAAPASAVAVQPVEGAEAPLAKGDPNAPLDMTGVGSYQVTAKETKQFADQAQKDEEMRAKLAESAAAAADAKGKEDDSKPQGKTKRASHRPQAAAKKGSGGSGLKSGGSAFDPLNSSLP